MSRSDYHGRARGLYGEATQRPASVASAVPISAIEAEPVEWLVPGRVPWSALTLLVGDPGLGKSLWTCPVAAEVSRAGGEVLLVTAEDSIAATVRARLEAVHADLSRVQSQALTAPLARPRHLESESGA